MQYSSFFKHEKYITFLCNIDVLCEKYGKLPHEIITLEPWQFELLMMCNEARTQYENNNKSNNKSDSREDINEYEYFEHLTPIEKENYIKLKSLNYNPIPRVSSSSKIIEQ